jgi:hypothetical protein
MSEETAERWPKRAIKHFEDWNKPLSAGKNEHRSPLSPKQDGNTALIMTASSGRLDVVQLLLDSKADLQAASKVPGRLTSP